MRRLTGDQNTTRELMAIRGYKTLAAVERYTNGANNKKLARSGRTAKARTAKWLIRPPS
jgi:hypothetical protein